MSTEGARETALAIRADRIQQERRQAFVRALAEFLSADLARRSIELQMGKPEAQQWAKLRGTTPLCGYLDADETERVLGEFLGIPTPTRSEEQT